MLTNNGMHLVIDITGSHRLDTITNMNMYPNRYLNITNTQNKRFCGSNSGITNEWVNIGGGSASATSSNIFYEGYSSYPDIINTNSTYMITNNSDIDDTTDLATRSAANICPLVLFIGDGTTQPTANDYKLEHCITEYTRLLESVNLHSSNSQIIVGLRIQANEDLAINEIGCYGRFTQASGTPQARNTNVLSLLDRKTLNSTVNISKGDVIDISYTIDFRNLNESTM